MWVKTHDPRNGSDRKQRILSTATELDQTVLSLFLDYVGGQQHFSDSDDCSLVSPGDFPEFLSPTSSQKTGIRKFVDVCNLMPRIRYHEKLQCSSKSDCHRSLNIFN